MIRRWIPLLLFFLLIISACSTGLTTDDANSTIGDENTTADQSSPETITYESENGPVEVPADPQRVVVLASFTGNVMALDVNLVGVDAWSKMNPRFDDALEHVEEVSDESLEKLIELEPDLIIGLSTINNVDKLNEIAPTVTYTYAKVDYLTQHAEIGKLLNKAEEAQAWVDDFKERAQAAGDEIKETIGAETTVSVMESFDKQLYVYGDNWGRGTEILYQEMELEMPAKVKETALVEGYHTLSAEVFPEFAGDYIIFSKFQDSDNSFQETDTYKNIPAVQNNQVFEVNGEAFYFNDPLTLEFQLDFFTEKFLGD